MPDLPLAERVERIEAHLAIQQLAIQQLAIRYAMAVDARDMEAWVRCFRPDVDMGRHGTGREALRRYIDPMVRRFCRSVHQICGHRIELSTRDTATGAIYCRAEHEAGQEWIVMAIASLTIIAARELDRYGVTVNAIAPTALTRMTEDIEMMRAAAASSDLSPEAISPLVVWLGSAESREVTGRVFGVWGTPLRVE